MLINKQVNKGQFWIFLKTKINAMKTYQILYHLLHMLEYKWIESCGDMHFAH